MKLEPLKAAIEKVEAYRAAPLMVQLHNAIGYTVAERDAWKAAYSWARGPSVVEGTPFGNEWQEGLRLIQERLARQVAESP